METGSQGTIAVDWEIIPYDNIDKLLLVEARISGMVAGVVPRLYTRVRGAGEPLCLQVANEIISRPKGHIGIVTGVFFPPYFPAGEIDGPIGALVLARSLSMLGYRCSIIMEPAVIAATQRVADEMSWNAVFVDSAALVDSGSISEVTDRLDIVIASERVGVNSMGIRHSINGTKFDDAPVYPWADILVEDAAAKGILTIGIGDGGNEIGFGREFDFAREMVPNGSACRCECGGGMVTRTATEYLLPVNVSNFGVYGLIAAIGLLTKNPDILHTSDAELKLLASAVNSGLKDGGSGLEERAQDGIPDYGAAGLVDLLAAIVHNALREYERQF